MFCLWNSDTNSSLNIDNHTIDNQCCVLNKITCVLYKNNFSIESCIPVNKTS